jgi:hypothetical protein
MDGLDLGALIGLGALIVLLLVFAPIAYGHDRRMARRRCADDGAAGVAAFGIGAFGGDGGAGCSDGGGGSC